VQREHVEVSLHDDGGPGAPDGVQRGVQAVKRLLLVNSGDSGELTYFAILDLGVQHPSAEADHPLSADR
jgi:hypothetical protein